MESKTFTNRSNARRAGVQAGIPVEQVEITVHKNKGDVRFGFKQADQTQTVTPAKAKAAAKVAPAASVPAATAPATAAPVVTAKAKTAAPAVTTVQRETRNGIKRPSPGGACAAVWDWLDSNPGVTVKEAKAAASQNGFNENNVACEFYQHRKFNHPQAKA